MFSHPPCHSHFRTIPLDAGCTILGGQVTAIFKKNEDCYYRCMSGHKGLQGWAERAAKFIEDVVVLSEIMIAVILAILVLLGVVYLFSSLWNALGEGVLINGKRLIELLDIALIVFISIELFRITLAYITGQHVLPTVVEAAFVAIGRKIVLYEYKVEGIYGALALAALLIGVTAAHFFTHKKEPTSI